MLCTGKLAICATANAVYRFAALGFYRRRFALFGLLNSFMSYRGYTQVTAIESGEIQYDRLVSVEPAVGVGKSTGGLLTEQATALVFTGFDITGTVRGLELKLEVTRLARTQDKTIQLWVNGAATGPNLADLTAGDVHVYTWTDLDLEWDSSMGVVIDLQPHTQYPSSNTIYIRSVGLRKTA